VWNSPTICVYDWSFWNGSLIVSIWPKSRRIPAKFPEAPQEIAARLPRKTKFLLIHLDTSVMSLFISSVPELVEVLSQRGVRLLNHQPSDIRKRAIQARCHDFGLPSVAAEITGPDDELLIVKTDLNSGGTREQWLTPTQKTQLNLPPGERRMKSPDDYFVRRRADIPADVWNDPALVVERYVKNPLGRFYRVYFVMNAIVISEAYTDTMVKRMAGPIRRINHFLWRQEEQIYSDSNVANNLPPALLKMAGAFAHRLQLDYGAIDVVESETGEFYVVDLNKTPYWGDEKQRGLLEHLRSGFSKALQD
jgi:hypothetical protein